MVNSVVVSKSSDINQMCQNKKEIKNCEYNLEGSLLQIWITQCFVFEMEVHRYHCCDIIVLFNTLIFHRFPHFEIKLKAGTLKMNIINS